jgi:uncharacterized protein (TIGR03437 family)
VENVEEIQRNALSHFQVGCLLICAIIVALIAKTAITSSAPNQNCLSNAAIPSGYVPFSEVHSVSAANASGDRVVLGKSTVALYLQMTSLPMPETPNQRFCEPVQLAPNFFAITYVPTAQERNGDFSPFAGLLIDPAANQPFPGGKIPANRLGAIFGWRIARTVASLGAVSAASYVGTKLASESIVAIFGSGLADMTMAASSDPLPTMLGGTSVKIKDNAGMERLAPLFFVSPNQINCQIPMGSMNGRAALTITKNDEVVGFGTAQISSVAPALFAANSDGQGVAAALALRAKPDGSQIYEPVVMFDPMLGKFVSVPIDLGTETDQVFLILFGTGIRFQTMVRATVGGADAQVDFAGAQGDFVGLDQVNLLLPRSLMGRGETDVMLTVDGEPSNTVKVNFR